MNAAGAGSRPGLHRQAVRLEPKVMQVLVCLAEHQGELVTKEQLIRAVWADTFVTDDVLTRCISELRKALNDDPKQPRFIETIPKSGYRLIASGARDWSRLSRPTTTKSVGGNCGGTVGDRDRRCCRTSS